ncbi:hypothetical protein IWQ60_003780 [Tieghemiomyces parasiticus]|uniref:Uncharacterized protein n=1 Tax=Tieghemiomyces parasiticus TaxID=78921 RepID=A0A9W8DW52_9FUNG|nr:hypothetical protein IWQ60_003780 [Tieghemiomyces parasiticus]
MVHTVVHYLLELESHNKDIASRTESWFKEWINHESPPDYSNPPVPGEDNRERLDRELRFSQRVRDQDYRALRNKYLDNEVRDEDIREIKEYMQGTIWPVAKPLVEAILYRQVLHRTIHKYRVTPLGDVYANAQVSSYPSYPLSSDEKDRAVEGVTIVDDGNTVAYLNGTRAVIGNAGNVNIFLSGAICDFRPELRKINDAVRPIKFDDVFNHNDEANLALRFPQALRLGRLPYLNSLQQVLVSKPGRYGVMDILRRGSAIPTSHLQFMEVLTDHQGTKNAIAATIDAHELGDRIPTLAQVTNQMQEYFNWRTFEATGNLYDQRVRNVIHQSIVVAFVALRMPDYLNGYLASRTLGTTPHPYEKNDQVLAILVADRTEQLGFIGEILKWDTGFSDDEACKLKGSGLHLGWEPRTEILKDLVQRCEEVRPTAYFQNDLPVYIGTDDKLYFLTYDSKVLTEPTTLQ